MKRSTTIRKASYLYLDKEDPSIPQDTYRWHCPPLLHRCHRSCKDLARMGLKAEASSSVGLR